MDSTKKYKVLGVEGETVTVAGTEYLGGTGHVIELTDEQAAEALAESKIELVAEGEESTATGEGENTSEENNG